MNNPSIVCPFCGIEIDKGCESCKQQIAHEIFQEIDRISIVQNVMGLKERSQLESSWQQLKQKRLCDICPDCRGSGKFNSKLTKNVDTKENREFWKHIRECSRIVKTWPKWK